MRVVYFGSDVFLPCFEYFAREHEVLALYTYHNAEDYFSEYAVVREAAKRGIRVHYELIRPQEITRLFTQDGCELFFVAEYDRFLTLPRELPGFRGINTHCSLLPQGRGYYPIESAMEEELSVTGVTMHKLSPRLDGGDILLQRRVEITPDMDSVDVYLRCAAYAGDMLGELMEDFEGYWQGALAQREKLPCGRRPGEARLTLLPGTDRAGALEMFRKYNSLTQVQTDEGWFYVTGMTAGTQIPDRQILPLSRDRILYRVRDGHLRLHIRPREAGRT